MFCNTVYILPTSELAEKDHNYQLRQFILGLKITKFDVTTNAQFSSHCSLTQMYFSNVSLYLQTVTLTGLSKYEIS